MAQQPVVSQGHWSTKFNFFVARTSIGELSSTFYAEFIHTHTHTYIYIYINRIFLSGRVSKIQRNLYVQNGSLRAHETGRNVHLKCRGV
jgi:hypothetical protein